MSQSSTPQSITGTWESHVYVGDNFWGVHYVSLTQDGHLLRGVM
jgi:hypothetical protein